jgi:hypothetical protein
MILVLRPSVQYCDFYAEICRQYGRIDRQIKNIIYENIAMYQFQLDLFLLEISMQSM